MTFNMSSKWISNHTDSREALTSSIVTGASFIGASGAMIRHYILCRLKINKHFSLISIFREPLYYSSNLSKKKLTAYAQLPLELGVYFFMIASGVVRPFWM